MTERNRRTADPEALARELDKLERLHAAQAEEDAARRADTKAQLATLRRKSKPTRAASGRQVLVLDAPNPRDRLLG